ncbi:MAG: hypothetical protein J7484_07765 [Microbacterium sp.]|nr:hypothetical protein [Microbacterium sp.]
MRAARVPDAWDHVGFAEFRAIVAEVCEDDVARSLMTNNRAAQDAYENPGFRARSRPQVDQASIVAAAAQLRAHAGRQRAELRQRVGHLDSASLLGAISGLGALPEPGRADLITAPGVYDREVEWLSRLPLVVRGEIPSWDDVVDALTTARRCLLLEYYTPSLNASRFDRLRQRSVMSGDLGTAYAPVAADLAQRLLASAMRHDRSLADSHLANIIASTDRALVRYAQGMARVVEKALIVPRDAHRTRLASRVMQAWTVSEFVDSLSMDPLLSQDPSVRALTVPAGDDPNPTADLRSHPFLGHGSSALLLLPRRIVCDRHELVDIAVARHLRAERGSPGVYPDLRARMLDDAIADSLRRILPGSRAHVGEQWMIDGRRRERDVVVLYEDIAVCVETKAPRYIPSRRSAHTDVVNVLRDDIAKGVEQVGSIADALEAGTAELDDGRVLPPVRRAYRLVASFNGWWGIDLAVTDLVHAGALPTQDAAMITSVDKFLCYETLFESPADFISYLDHRLDHQRRPWLVVADEFELIGGYFTNPNDEWRRRPPRNTSMLIKPTFQADVDRTIIAAYTDSGRRSAWLQRKHAWFVDENLTRLESTRPAAWLQAFSALSRLPLRAQQEMVDVIKARRPSPPSSLRSVTTTDRSVVVIVVPETGTISSSTWVRKVSDVPVGTPIVAVRQTESVVLAARGVDDVDCWVDPAWAATMQAREPNPSRTPPRSQRTQPRRRVRRARDR